MDEETKVSQGPLNLPKLSEKSSPCLVVIHGNNLGEKYILNRLETIIGRKEDADIQVEEENVSRQHAKIMLHDSNVTIKDLKSTNGTFINTKRLKDEVVLKEGDLILIGNTILKFIPSGNIEHVYHEEMYKLATLDGLTQIFNKTHILERIEDEFLRSLRYKRKLSLLFLDFDYFHELNSKYTHLGGDQVLKKVASLVLRNLRKEDIFGRYGGEEFAIVLPETDEKSAFNIADKLRALVEKTKIEYNDHNIPVTISIGVASVKFDRKGNPQPPVASSEKFIELADKALFEAKNKGRNRVCVV